MKLARYIVAMSFMLVLFAFGRERLVRASSDDSFRKTLARSPYAVVVFYDKSRENMRDPQIKNKISDLEDMFTSLSKNPDYVEAELVFIRVDVARSGLMSVAQSYGIRTFPAFRLFVGDQMIRGVGINAYAYRAQVQSLINTHLQSYMQNVMQEKQRKRERDLERAKIQAYERAAYWGPYWNGYGYYPYWAGPYWGPGWGYGYYGQPGFGFNVGF